MLYLSQAIGRPVLDAERRAARQGRRPDRRRRRPLSAGHRPRRRDRPAPDLPALVVRSPASTRPARGCRPRPIDITKFQQRPNEILLRADLLDKQIVDIDGRKVVRVNDLRLDDVDGTLHLVAVDVGAAGLLRRLGHRGRRTGSLARNLRLPDPGALHRLGGRRPGRDQRSPRSSCASRTRAWPSSTRPTSPRSSTSSRRATGPASSPSLDDEAVADAIEEMEPETQVEVLEDLAPGARRRHPRGDVARRRGRPRRRPVRRRPARSCSR